MLKKDFCLAERNETVLNLFSAEELRECIYENEEGPFLRKQNFLMP